MDKKTLFAFFLIAIVLILMPYYMNIVAPQEQPASPGDSIAVIQSQPTTPIETEQRFDAYKTNDDLNIKVSESVQLYNNEQTIAVETPLYIAQISSKNGGSFTSFILKNYKATDSTSVQLVDNFNNNNLLFSAISVDGVPLVLRAPWKTVGSQSKITVSSNPQSLKYSTVVLGKTVFKTLTFNPNSYQIDVSFDLSDIKDQISQGSYSLSWNGGLPTTEKNLEG